MKQFSYMYAFYKEFVYSVEEMGQNLDQIEIANEVEKRLGKNNYNLDIIRDMIVRSFKYKKGLSLEDRYNYVRGMIYSSQYLNEKDIDDLEDSFRKAHDDKILAQSLFAIRPFTDEFDYDYFLNYLDNIRFESNEDVLKNNGDLKDLVKKAKEKYEQEQFSPMEEPEAKEYLDEEDEENEEEEEVENFKMRDLSIRERIAFFFDYFPVYVQGITKHKNIKKRSNEYKLVVEGMKDYFNYIIHVYENTYEILVKDFIKSSKNLTLNI